MIYLDFDGILFKSDYEPLLSSLAALEVEGLSADDIIKLKAAYKLAKPSIHNVADLFSFTISNSAAYTKIKSLQEFTDSIKAVRKAATEDGSVYHSFEPTAFFPLILKWWIDATPMLSVLTSRDVATASTILHHYGFSDSITIYSSMELKMSKGAIISNHCMAPFAVVDDMMGNLTDIHENAYIDSSLLIFGNWGYGEMLRQHPHILQCSAAEAMTSLKAWSSSLF
jgi:hypothetical protein